MSVRHLLLVCVVAACCLLPLTGCGDKTDAGTGSDSSNTTATE